jgi:hypothetical protein
VKRASGSPVEATVTRPLRTRAGAAVVAFAARRSRLPWDAGQRLACAALAGTLDDDRLRFGRRFEQRARPERKRLLARACLPRSVTGLEQRLDALLDGREREQRVRLEAHLAVGNEDREARAVRRGRGQARPR